MADPTNPTSPAPGPGGGAERRLAARYRPGPSLCGHLVDGQGGVIIPDEIRDLSTGGIGLVISRPIDPTSTPVVDLFNAANNQPCRQPLRVVHFRQQPDGRFLLGAAFTRVLGRVEVKELVS